MPPRRGRDFQDRHKTWMFCAKPPWMGSRRSCEALPPAGRSAGTILKPVHEGRVHPASVALNKRSPQLQVSRLEVRELTDPLVLRRLLQKAEERILQALRPRV